GTQSTWWPRGNDITDREHDPCVKLYTMETAWIATKQEHIKVKSFNLNQNYPNPFNPATTITFDLSEDTDVKILIYDMAGRLIRELVNQPMNVGTKTISWDSKDNLGQSVSGGIYFYKLQAGDFTQTKKMVLMK
ncbi:T9SS type A sorting domain-containing protein, partial [bacterium]|nr:T9SS type A sorting domain-containing protein [bacterium]